MTSPSAAPLLPLVENPDDPLVREEFAKLAAGSGILNLHRMMAHAPALMKASGDMALAFRRDTKLPRAVAELAILRAAQVLDAPYVWARHLPLARDCGVTDAADQRTRVLAGQHRLYAGAKGGARFRRASRAAIAARRKHRRGASAPLLGPRDRRARDGDRLLRVDRDLRQSLGSAGRKALSRR